MEHISFEELTPGRVIELGSYTVEPEEALAFAQEFDPQPMHLNAQAAEAGLLGGLSTSGWHTCAIMMRLMCDALMNRIRSQGSPGVEHVRWLKPVRPGDTLSGTVTIESARRSAKRPGSGIVTITTVITNQDGAQVLDALGDLRWHRRAGMSFYETIAVGETQELGTHRFTAEDIKRFAAKYDPQPFHLDETAAEGSLLGALCASGWHTAAVFMRLNVEHRRRAVEEAVARGMAAPELGPSPGVTNLSWPRPVFAGDTLTYRQTVTTKRVSEKRPGWAVVETHVEATNQRGEIAFAMDGALFIGTR